MEREGDPARWFAFVTEGCFKYVKYGMSDDKAHITWFSFEGEFVCDHPTFLYGRPSQATLLQRCPGIMEFLDLQDIASFLNVHPNTVSKIRRDITFGDR